MRAKVLLIVRVGVAALFIGSGFLKLVEPYQNFLAAIYGYKLLIGAPAQWLAITLPWAELIFGVFLLTGLWIRLSAAALWVMNSMFIFAISSAISRKLMVDDCGCFGKGSLPLDKVLKLDICLWFLFAALFFQASAASYLSLDRYFEHKRKH